MFQSRLLAGLLRFLRGHRTRIVSDSHVIAYLFFRLLRYQAGLPNAGRWLGYGCRCLRLRGRRRLSRLWLGLWDGSRLCSRLLRRPSLESYACSLRSGLQRHAI